MAKQTVTVYINDRFEYFIGEDQIAVDQMEQLIGEAMAGQVEGSVVLRADQSVPVQHIVNVIDAVNKINERYNTKHKVILATRPN